MVANPTKPSSVALQVVFPSHPPMHAAIPSITRPLFLARESDSRRKSGWTQERRQISGACAFYYLGDSRGRRANHPLTACRHSETFIPCTVEVRLFRDALAPKPQIFVICSCPCPRMHACSCAQTTLQTSWPECGVAGAGRGSRPQNGLCEMHGEMRVAAFTLRRTDDGTTPWN
jgi:hypothetical protein